MQRKARQYLVYFEMTISCRNFIEYFEVQARVNLMLPCGRAAVLTCSQHNKVGNGMACIAILKVISTPSLTESGW
jgi:hypothetical protein